MKLATSIDVPLSYDEEKLVRSGITTEPELILGQETEDRAPFQAKIQKGKIKNLPLEQRSTKRG